MKKLIISVICCLVLIASARAGDARRDSIRIQPSMFDEWGGPYGAPNPYSRTWKAFAGYNELSEPEMFSLCGKPELSKRAQDYRDNKSGGVIMGLLLDIGGTGMMIVSVSNSSSGLLTGGAAASILGSYVLLNALLKPPRALPYEAARTVVDEYNAEHK